MSEAVQCMAQRKISELPVVDGEGRPVGLLDITDVLGLLPREEAAWFSAAGEPDASPQDTPPPEGQRPIYRVYRESPDSQSP
jgi:arabinose-5-phosphate isomerase